ncbi:MAG: hypothetical protein ABI686_00765 [Acidobacteriota bacterium]
MFKSKKTLMLIRQILLIVFVVGLASFSICLAQNSQQSPMPKTKIIVLGVGHSPQLVAESYRPAVLRAFLDKVNPDAICIERSPEEFARNDFYEFTYEQQYLTVPYAREHRIPLCPIDWLPAAEDTSLAFGIADLEVPTFIRRTSGFQGFISFTDKEDLSLDLFYAETESDREKQRKFANTLPEQAGFDYPRRLYLYRTFMQTKRIAQAAKAYRGQTVLVVVGSLHKNDIEQILKDDSTIEIVQPSSFGHPDTKSIAKAIKREDLLAIATFNLLGVQSKTGNINWDWMNRILKDLEKEKETAETLLLKTRWQVLTKRITAQEALSSYQRASDLAKSDEQFTWTGVKDRSRIDSYFDPFGNLSIGQRAEIEMARENNKLKRLSAVEESRKRLMSQLSELKIQQLAAYWDEYILKMD